MTIEFRQSEDVVRDPGRPVLARTTELKEALVAMKNEAEKTKKYAFVIDLADDEQGPKHFSRFMQRCRSAASIAGIKVSITNPQDGKTARIRICSNEDDE